MVALLFVFQDPANAGQRHTRALRGSDPHSSAWDVGECLIWPLRILRAAGISASKVRAAATHRAPPSRNSQAMLSGETRSTCFPAPTRDRVCGAGRDGQGRRRRPQGCLEGRETDRATMIERENHRQLLPQPHQLALAVFPFEREHVGGGANFRVIGKEELARAVAFGGRFLSEPHRLHALRAGGYRKDAEIAYAEVCAVRVAAAATGEIRVNLLIEGGLLWIRAGDR